MSKLKPVISFVLCITILFVSVMPIYAISSQIDENSLIESSAFKDDNGSKSLVDRIVEFFDRIFFSTIQFDTDGGTEIEDIHRLKFMSVSKPADPIKEGYTFVGWDKDIPSRMPTKNMTVKAIWEKNIYTIDWIVDGVAVYSEQHYYNDVISSYKYNTKEGYAFSGWDKIVPEHMPACDIVFYGSTIPNSDTILTIKTFFMDFNGEYTSHQDKIVSGETDTLYTYNPEAVVGFSLDPNSILTTIVKGDNSSEITVYYVREQYDIKFVFDNGINEDIIESYYYDESIFVPAEPQKGGHTFIGWLPEVPEKATKSETYTAQWEVSTEIIVTKNQDEFTQQMSTMISDALNDENFNVEEAINDEYYSARLIVQCEEISKVDFESLGADTVIVNEDGTAVLQFLNRDLAEECAEKLKVLDFIEFTEPDAFECYSPSDIEIEEIPSISGNSWGETFMNADKYAYYLENNRYFDMVTVAVVDSGVDMDHPFLKNRITSNGWDYIQSDNNPEDENGHGTHVAGTIVDCTNNLNIKIMPVRVLDANGCSFRSSVVLGISHAVNNGADVINLSLGGTHSKYIDNAIQEAVDKGSTCVVAAGNGKKVYKADGEFIDSATGDRYGIEPDDTKNVCPAHLNGVITVGAIDNNTEKAFFSNYGDSVDLVAPGVDVISSYKNGKYAKSSGTSMAAPHISAAVAMLLLSNPTITPSQIETFIKDNCVIIMDEVDENFYGTGYLNLYNLIPDCNVDFNTNGGGLISQIRVKNSTSFVMPSTSKNYNIVVNANGGTTSKTSYSKDAALYGWYDNSGFSGTKYTVGESYVVLKDTTMYAKWTNPKLYEFSLIEPTRNGFYFNGWYDASYGGMKYSTSSEISSNMTLYAQWLPNAYTVKWSTSSTYSINVSRTASPYANAVLGNLSNNSTIYYGDVLSVTYNASYGYTLSSKGATSITVTGDVNSSNIYATATPGSYTYNIAYKSSNGTNLGSTTVTNKFGTTNTITAPAKSGYVTPAAQSVTWNSTSAKTITFIYYPEGVQPLYASGTVDTSPHITYSARVEYANRTANSVQIRVCWTSTMHKYSYTVYGQRVNVTAGGTTTSADVVAFNTWRSAVSYDRSSGEVATGWITVPVNTTNATTVPVGIYYYQFNSNNLDMNKYNGESAVSTTWNVSIPAY